MKLKHFLYVAIGGVGLYFAYRALVHGSKKTPASAVGSGVGATAFLPPPLFVHEGPLSQVEYA